MAPRAYTKVYLSPELKAHAQQLAKDAGVTESELFRRLLETGGAFKPSRERGDLVRNLLELLDGLLKTNADMARLGNLIKMALTEDAILDDEEDVENLGALLSEIWSRQGEIKSTVTDIKTLVRQI